MQTQNKQPVFGAGAPAAANGFGLKPAG